MPSARFSTWFIACSLLVGLGLFLSTVHAQALGPSDRPLRTSGPVPVLTGESGAESPASPQGMSPERKKSYLRLWARVSLGIIILLILFVVILMVVNRRLRLSILGRDRRVKFNPVEDLWWKKPEDKKPPDRKP